MGSFLFFKLERATIFLIVQFQPMFRRFGLASRTNVRRLWSSRRFHAGWRDETVLVHRCGAILDVCNAAICTYGRAMAQRRFRSFWRTLPSLVAFLPLGCGVSSSQPDTRDVAVRINGKPLTAQYLHVAREELSSYAQERFSGVQGDRAFLAALVDLELLSLKAKQSGAFADPRTQWSVVDTFAQRMARRIKERRLPRQGFASQDDQLLAYVQAHPETMRHPQRRKAELALVEDWTAGEELFARRGQLSKAQGKPSLTETQWMTRDDQRYPVFHRLLFAPKLEVGQWLAAPVPVAGKVGVARLSEIEPARPLDLENPEDRAMVVDAAIQAPQAEALEGYLEELRRRWPLKRRLR